MKKLKEKIIKHEAEYRKRTSIAHVWEGNDFANLYQTIYDLLEIVEQQSVEIEMLKNSR